MKTQAAIRKFLVSLARHAITAVAGVGAFLASHGLVAAEDAAPLGELASEAGAGVVEFLAAVISAILARVILAYVPGLSGTTNPPATRGGSAPGGGETAALLLGVCGWAAAGVMVASSLSSCAGGQYVGPRLVVGVESPDARVSYDSAQGGSVRVDARIRATK